jgi:hypothetical protein
MAVGRRDLANNLRNRDLPRGFSSSRPLGRCVPGDGVQPLRY